VSQIVTFYSFKGGVGRSMALANVAVLLARRGCRVLAVDWDLEAPGLERYFDYFELSVKRGGLLPFLVEQHARLADGEANPERYRDHLWSIQVGGPEPLRLFTSGRTVHADYARTLEQFGWSAFFERGGGDFLERLRELWRVDFDVVLIDSRTGMSDAGGICTIQMPDVLVTMFTPNYQSLLGVRDLIESAQAARQRLAYDRMRLTVLPIASRFPTSGSHATTEWLDRFGAELGGCLGDWLPKNVALRDVFDRMKLPHDDDLAFGERLAVVDQDTDLFSGLGIAYDRIAGLLASEFKDLDAALGPAARPASSDIATKPSLTRSTTEDYDVFVSYANEATILREWLYPFVAAVSQALAAELGRPVSIHLEAEVPANADWPRPYSVMLSRSRVMLAVLTPRYFASSWCLFEWQAFEGREDATAADRARIVPLALRGVSELPPRFRERAFVDGSAVTLQGSLDATSQLLVGEVAKAVASALEDLRLARAPPAPDDAVQPDDHDPLEVLFLSASPVGTTPMALEVEAREIERELRGRSVRSRIHFETQLVLEIEDLAMRIAATRAEVVHWSGRGTSDGLFLKGSDSLPRLVSLGDLERAFGGDTRVRLVVLDACYSEKQALALREHVDCVVGVVPSVTESSARAFCRAFYQGLASGWSVMNAVFAAQVALVELGSSVDDARILTHDGVDANLMFFAKQLR
jgi:cellulose biosynthesis protein BcsQ